MPEPLVGDDSSPARTTEADAARCETDPVAGGRGSVRADVPAAEDAGTLGARAALRRDAVSVLSGWRAPTAEQDDLRRQYLDHLAAHPDGLWREGPPAHVTASCFVLDEQAEHVLLCLHGKGRFWVQFGGHLEPGDRMLADAALREAREESGVDRLTLLGCEPVDLDRHALSSAFGRCTEHLDVAFAATADRATPTAVSAESDDVAWWPVDALPPDVVPDLPRRLHPLLSRLTS